MNKLNNDIIEQETHNTFPNKSNELIKNLNNNQEIQYFIKNKIDSRNQTINSNPTLTKEEKEKLIWNFESFKKQTENNWALFQQYKSQPKEIFKKALQELLKRKIINPEKETLIKDTNDININLIWWDIVIELNDEEMNYFFWKWFNWITIPRCKIDWIKTSPIVIRKSNEKKEIVVNDELQHFYNKYLFNYPDTIKDIIWSALANETISQTINPRHWDTVDERKLFLSSMYSFWIISWDNEQTSKMMTFLKEQENNTKMYINQIVSEYLEYIDIARELKKSWIENYIDILASTPIERRKDLKRIYLNK